LVQSTEKTEVEYLCGIGSCVIFTSSARKTLANEVKIKYCSNFSVIKIQDQIVVFTCKYKLISNLSANNGINRTARALFLLDFHPALIVFTSFQLVDL